MLSSVEQAFVGRDEIRAPLETPAWEGGGGVVVSKKIVLALRASVWCNSNNKGGGGEGGLTRIRHCTAFCAEGPDFDSQM